MPLAELGCSSEHERVGTGSVGLRRSTYGLGNRSPWPMAFSRSRPRGPDKSGSRGIVSHELALSLRVPASSAAELPRDGPKALSHPPSSPHEVLGPFSTSNVEDSPTRASTPASFRLRRWFGLDGFLPSTSCRFVSPGGTHGVPKLPGGPKPRFRATCCQVGADAARPAFRPRPKAHAQCEPPLRRPARRRVVDADRPRRSADNPRLVELLSQSQPKLKPFPWVSL